VLLFYGLVAAAAYEAAMILLPRLYNPDRYLNAPAPILAGVLVAVGGAWLWERRDPERPWLRGTSQAVVLSLMGLAFLGGLVYTPPAEYGTDLSPQRPLATWLREHLAPSEMFAAYPINDADNLMTLAERPCLATHECDWPFHSGYLREVRRRLRLLFPAYFAYSAEDVRPLVQETPVRFLVIRREDVTDRLAGDEENEPRTRGRKSSGSAMPLPRRSTRTTHTWYSTCGQGSGEPGSGC
jgi:hypothetical protein